MVLKLQGKVVWVVSIPIELDTEFRDVIFKNKGTKRGNLKESVEEAIREWIRKKRQEAS